MNGKNHLHAQKPKAACQSYNPSALFISLDFELGRSGRSGRVVDRGLGCFVAVNPTERSKVVDVNRGVRLAEEIVELAGECGRALVERAL